MATVSRRPFAGQLVTFHSPEDPNVTFDFKRCGVAENLARQNLASKVRYIVEDETGRSYQERDFPMGELRLETLKLSLAGWNISDDDGRLVPINEKTITTYLSPKEFEFAYDKALEVNPMWRGGDSDSESA